MTPERPFNNPEAMPFMVSDHERRLQVLEREKLSTEVQLIKRVVADIKAEQERRFTTLDTKVNTLMTEKEHREGGRTSWKAVWVYIVGGLVAIAAVSSPFLTYITSR
jgi:hypothetical protein